MVELGSEAEVLASVGRHTWDAPTLRAIGQQHRVDVLVLGRLDMEKAKPQVQLSNVWQNMSARADINAALSARLMETGTGATMWTNSAKVTNNVAHASFHGRGGSFAARDPEAEYGNMINGLVWEITHDFRVHYVTRKVRKDEVHVASVRE